MYVSDGDERRPLKDNSLPSERGQASGGRRPIRLVIVTLMVVAVVLVGVLATFIVLSSTPVFTISSIDTEATEHLTAENIAKLANVEEGTTLLTIDEEAIVKNLKRNPWVGDVQLVREFPDKLKIVITERTMDCLVKMSTASVCWCLGNDSVWIEPINLTILDGQSADDAALALAQKMDALLIIDVPTSLSPTAGESTANDALMAVATYRKEFSDEFSAQIVRFRASSVESIACTLSNGVEISLGSPVDIDLKEAVVNEILEKHPNQITYINVRVPSQPSYRRLGNESVTGGSGVTVSDPSTTAGESTATGTSQDQTTTGQSDGTTTDSATTDTASGDQSADESYDDGSGYDESYDDGSYDEYYDDGSGYDESYDETEDYGYYEEDYSSYDESYEEY